MASGRLVCVLRGDRSELSLDTLDCDDQSHHHITRAQAIVKVENGEVEWISKPANRKVRAIVRILKGSYSIRGLSAKVGQDLARRIRNKEDLALVILAEIQRRTLAPTPVMESSRQSTSGDTICPCTSISAKLSGVRELHAAA
jgi:hypothetical protein